MQTNEALSSSDAGQGNDLGHRFKAEFSHRGKDFLGSSEGQRTEVRLKYNEKKRSSKRHQLDLK